MPKEYLKCIRDGGKVRTASGPSKRFKLKAGEYRKYCYINGKTYLGHKKQKKISKSLEYKDWLIKKLRMTEKDADKVIKKL